MPQIDLKQLPGRYAIARLAPDAATPDWWSGSGFCSVSRSADEVSIICLEERIPPEVRTDGGWTAFQFIGPFAFGETGIVLSVIRPLSENGIGVFVVSTFDGDHLLLKQADVPHALRYLQAAGHRLVRASSTGSASP